MQKARCHGWQVWDGQGRNLACFKLGLHCTPWQRSEEACAKNKGLDEIQRVGFD